MLMRCYQTFAFPFSEDCLLVSLQTDGLTGIHMFLLTRFSSQTMHEAWQLPKVVKE